MKRLVVMVLNSMGLLAVFFVESAAAAASGR
jgi:hypothetical protein